MRNDLDDLLFEFMKHEFQFTFDVAFICAAGQRDLLWRGYVIAGMLLLASAILRVLNGYWEPIITSVLVLAAIFVVWRFHALLKTIGRRVHAMWIKQSPAGVIRYEMDDKGFDVIHENGRSNFTWEGLRRLWRYDDVWLLEILKMQSVFFPPDQVRGEVLDYIVERCRSAGVRT